MAASKRPWMSWTLIQKCLAGKLSTHNYLLCTQSHCAVCLTLVLKLFQPPPWLTCQSGVTVSSLILVIYHSSQWGSVWEGLLWVPAEQSGECPEDHWKCSWADRQAEGALWSSGEAVFLVHSSCILISSFLKSNCAKCWIMNKIQDHLENDGTLQNWCDCCNQWSQRSIKMLYRYQSCDRN